MSDTLSAEVIHSKPSSVSSSSSQSSNSSAVSSMELDAPSSLGMGGKIDPLDVSIPARLLTCSLPQETVTMSLDDVLHYAQPVADFTF